MIRLLQLIKIGDGSMNEITILGIDLAKNTFQLIGVDKHHKVVMKRRCQREKLVEIASNLRAGTTILMESCGTSNYWGRRFQEMGHTPKLISPQHVTPYVANHKNDYKDTEAIIEVGTRPRTKFVQIKAIEQQDIQSIHRVRERLVNNRICLSNQIRGLLLEYGIVIPKGFSNLTNKIVEILSEKNDLVSETIREILADIYDEFKGLSERITKYDKKIEAISNEQESCKLLKTIPGIGPITATALYASMGNGREMAAQIGLVPKQHSSGDRQILLGITKKGNRDLKQLLIHGARAVVAKAGKKEDKRSQWINKLTLKKHFNVVATALANRTARMAWAILQTSQPYNVNLGYAKTNEGGAC
jgi:transposase